MCTHSTLRRYAAAVATEDVSGQDDHPVSEVTVPRSALIARTILSHTGKAPARVTPRERAVPVGGSASYSHTRMTTAEIPPAPPSTEETIVATTSAPNRARNGDAAPTGTAAETAATIADTIADGFAATRDTYLPALTDAAGKTRELQKMWFTRAVTVTEQVLDVYEDGLHRYVDYRQRVADATGVDWVIGLTDSTSRIVESLGSRYPRMLRGLFR